MPETAFERFWRRLQDLGLNAYEARSYLVLVGHPRFKALELATRANVPRQKIYEVLDSLTEKGFAQVVQEKTKLFSAVEPGLAIPAYLSRRRKLFEQQLAEQSRSASALIDDLSSAYSEGQGGRGTLDFLRIVNEPAQTATQYRRMLAEVQSEYLEFSRPPYAVDPLDEQLVKQARARGVRCRLLLQAGSLDDSHRQRLQEYEQAGVEVRLADSLPHETGAVRLPGGADRSARPGDHLPDLDLGPVRPRGPGRGHEGPVRRPLAQGPNPL